MDTFTTRQGSPFSEPLDALLADIAIRVQLSQTNYNKAVARYKALSEWIERDGSPLAGLVALFYSQGSMAIGAVIASRVTNDEFDLDVVAQLDLPAETAPGKVLDLLFLAINGEPGSRYHGKVRRRTRCVTVEYADNMHIDVTPAVRRPGTPERESCIFHHRAKAPAEPSLRCVANPYGFAEWFKNVTPREHQFAEAFMARTAEYEQMLLAELAESEPVPQQEPVFQKSRAVIVLQLLKRWRNVQYMDRSGRQPPSIMIAKLVAENANRTHNLSQELLHQARGMLSVFEQSHREGSTVRLTNPACDVDVLTDRWPGSIPDQAIFIRDLQLLVTKAERLTAGCDLAEMRRIMVELFGETPAADVFGDFNRRFGNDVRGGRSRHERGTGRIVLPSAAAGAALPSVACSTPRHTFYGGEKWWK